MLGLPHELAETDACRVEHGLSAVTADRLHLFLNYIESLPHHERTKLRQAVQREEYEELSQLTSHAQLYRHRQELRETTPR